MCVCVCVCELYERNLEEGSFTGDREGYVR